MNLKRVLAMTIVHDLAEVEVGDIPCFETGDRKTNKAELELAAIERIATMLPAPEGEMVKQLWLEFEDGRTPEARFVRALDHLKVQVQHNLADLSTWEPVDESDWSIRKWMSAARTTRSCGNCCLVSGPRPRPRCERAALM